MSNTAKKYVSLAKLAKYDELLKAKMTTDDAKVLKDAKDYADSLKDNYEASGTVATAKQELQGNIDALANGTVAQNTASIAKLNGDANTTGSVAKAVADAKALVDADVDAVEAVANQNAADIGTMKGQIAALEAGTYDDSEVRGLIADNAEAIETMGQTHATDKSTLEAAIALKADKTALDAVSAVADAAATKTALEAEVKTRGEEITRVEGLVTAETQRATGVEDGLKGRIETMESFWVAAQADGTDSNVIDTLKEIQEYIAGDETGAGEMLASIQQNAKAIEDMDKAYKAADVTLQQNIDKKADSSDLEALDGRVGDLETASATHALKTEVEAVSGELTAYKNAHAGDYTNAQIDAAIKVVADDVAALNDVYATDAELAQAVADAKTDASNKDAVVLAEAQKASTAVQTALDTHTGNADIHVTAEQKTAWTTAAGKAHEHGNIQVLNGITSDKITEWDKVSAKADATALQAESERAVAKENELSAAIAAFVECSEQDVIDLFNA